MAGMEYSVYMGTSKEPKCEESLHVGPVGAATCNCGKFRWDSDLAQVVKVGGLADEAGENVRLYRERYGKRTP